MHLTTGLIESSSTLPSKRRVLIMFSACRGESGRLTVSMQRGACKSCSGHNHCNLNEAGGLKPDGSVVTFLSIKHLHIRLFLTCIRFRIPQQEKTEPLKNNFVVRLSVSMTVKGNLKVIYNAFER